MPKGMAKQPKGETARPTEAAPPRQCKKRASGSVKTAPQSMMTTPQVSVMGKGGANHRVDGQAASELPERSEQKFTVLRA